MQHWTFCDLTIYINLYSYRNTIIVRKGKLYDKVLLNFPFHSILRRERSMFVYAIISGNGVGLPSYSVTYIKELNLDMTFF